MLIPILQVMCKYLQYYSLKRCRNEERIMIERLVQLSCSPILLIHIIKYTQDRVGAARFKDISWLKLNEIVSPQFYPSKVRNCNIYTSITLPQSHAHLKRWPISNCHTNSNIFHKKSPQF